MEYQEQNESHRVRTIILTILIIIIVVVIGIGLVVVAMNSIHSSPSSGESHSSEPIVSQSDDHPAVAEPSSTSTTSPADQYNSKPTTVPANNTSSSTSDDIPLTGPEDMLFSALLIGIAVFLLGHNLQLAKRHSSVI